MTARITQYGKDKVRVSCVVRDLESNTHNVVKSPLGPGLGDGFLPPSESGSASHPTHDGKSWHADPSPGFRCLMEEFLYPSSRREASVRPVQPQHLGREASALPC